MKRFEKEQVAALAIVALGAAVVTKLVYDIVRIKKLTAEKEELLESNAEEAAAIAEADEEIIEEEIVPAEEPAEEIIEEAAEEIVPAQEAAAEAPAEEAPIAE